MDRKTQRKNIKERENPILGERSKTALIETCKLSYVHTGSRTGITIAVVAMIGVYDGTQRHG